MEVGVGFDKGRRGFHGSVSERRIAGGKIGDGFHAFDVSEFDDQRHRATRLLET